MRNQNRAEKDIINAITKLSKAFAREHGISNRDFRTVMNEIAEDMTDEIIDLIEDEEIEDGEDLAEYITEALETAFTDYFEDEEEESNSLFSSSKKRSRRKTSELPRTRKRRTSSTRTRTRRTSRVEEKEVPVKKEKKREVEGVDNWNISSDVYKKIIVGSRDCELGISPILSGFINKAYSEITVNKLSAIADGDNNNIISIFNLSSNIPFQNSFHLVEWLRETNPKLINRGVINVNEVGSMTNIPFVCIEAPSIRTFDVDATSLSRTITKLQNIYKESGFSYDLIRAIQDNDYRIVRAIKLIVISEINNLLKTALSVSASPASYFKVDSFSSIQELELSPSDSQNIVNTHSDFNVKLSEIISVAFYKLFNNTLVYPSKENLLKYIHARVDFRKPEIDKFKYFELDAEEKEKYMKTLQMTALFHIPTLHIISPCAEASFLRKVKSGRCVTLNLDSYTEAVLKHVISTKSSVVHSNIELHIITKVGQLDFIVNNSLDNGIAIEKI